MSSWKLVEAVAEETPAKANADQQGGRGNHAGRGSGRRGSGGGGRGGGGRHNQGNAMDYTNYLSPADRNYLSHMASQQIEFIFNLDNLCRDTFVRSYMDEDGFVPLPLLCTYQNVAAFGAPYYDVAEKLKALPPTSTIEFNAHNETIRLKTGWEQWLMPNSTGGRGVPRYVKQTPEQQQAYMEQLQYSYMAGAEMQQQEQAQEQAATAATASTDASATATENA
mmetsp:Transcript_66655/g.131102  ORF Transcript_66655/g.131102 Transcript_66655/m.131102 type:complete len:223 (+) Transcript_66655:83-751(+)|eukprot:CAMPEP_0170377130 /NCGR_PEP_ID=MMETSP0117_2-20130122/12103_1 /TAXON_ID=400756 /ORGANISM="Durinskia baltica, Strain CSIRO CS-38" /LENGTH=222 /DNA_ID=CAMNT_0010632397 /DNA_START=59 /DNA_END=727 /DNA_ORIENTATION=-